jgi:diaminopimelate decarboxylase
LLPVFESRELADLFGTPLYVYDLDLVAAAYLDLRSALPPEFMIFYSLEANPHPDVANALCAVGGRSACRAKAGSVSELGVALEAGFKASQCLYSGSGKSEAELVTAVSQGVQTFSVGSLSDLERVGSVARRFGTVIDCLLQIDTAGAEPGLDRLREQLLRLRTVAGTRLVGAHFNPLSDVKDERSLIGQLTQTVSLAARLLAEFYLPMRILNLGGGFWAPSAVAGARPVYPNLRVELERALDAHFPSWRRGTPRIACGSGRYLVGDCGVLISTVTNIEENHGRKFVMLDAPINPLGRPLRVSDDALGRDAGLPLLKVGDVVTVPNVGAYGATASLLLFLARQAPREVVVQGGRIVSVSQLRLRQDPAGGSEP